MMFMNRLIYYTMDYPMNTLSKRSSLDTILGGPMLHSLLQGVVQISALPLSCRTCRHSAAPVATATAVLASAEIVGVGGVVLVRGAAVVAGRQVDAVAAAAAAANVGKADTAAVAGLPPNVRMAAVYAHERNELTPPLFPQGQSAV
jgi:hypothetical protein